jgi:hypothetical protein
VLVYLLHVACLQVEQAKVSADALHHAKLAVGDHLLLRLAVAYRKEYIYVDRHDEGLRLYASECRLRRLALIRGAKRAGFTLGEVRTLVCGFPTETGAAERWQTVATEKLSEVDEAIAQLRIARDLL